MQLTAYAYCVVFSSLLLALLRTEPSFDIPPMFLCGCEPTRVFTAHGLPLTEEGTVVRLDRSGDGWIVNGALVAYEREALREAVQRRPVYLELEPETPMGDVKWALAVLGEVSLIVDIPAQ